MSTKPHYIFCSSELYLPSGAALPLEIPSEMEGQVRHSLALRDSGTAAVAVQVDDRHGREATVTMSVGTGLGAANEEGGCWYRLRDLYASADQDLRALAAPATRALGLLNWHRHTRFCAACGESLSDHENEMARQCPSCQAIYYPRLSPAIIVLVEDGDKFLLARHTARNTGVFSCIAGYLEHGESLEDCVAREVREETGLEITDIRYAGSQSWPYPDQYMVAFYARYAGGEIKVDPAEILEARWFTLDTLPLHPAAGTVAWRLIFHDFPKYDGKC